MSHSSEDRVETATDDEDFQTIKNERISERRKNTEARRQNDLQRIRNMKSTEGVQPLQLLPKEIWDKILDPNDVSARDLGNTYNVHELFQEILDTRRVRDILLPQVLMYIFSPERKPDHDQSRSNVNGSRPEITTTLSLSEFIRLREISKSIRACIDEWLENELMKNLRSEKGIKKIPSMTFMFSISRDNDNETCYCKEKLDGTLKNFGGGGSDCAKRFFLRSLNLRITNEVWAEGDFLQEFIEFTIKIGNLLKLIGNQIWRLKFSIVNLNDFEEDENISLKKIWCWLKEVLKQLPNLKWLVLYGEVSCFNPNRVVETYEFPRLSKLERICLSNDCRDDNVFDIFSQILRANTHVKMLNVIPGFHPHHNQVFFEKFWNPLLESLPELSLETYCIDNLLWHPRCCFEWIRPVSRFNRNWPLKRVHLSCNLTINLSSLFQYLESFQTTEHLTLRLMNVNFEEDVPTFLKLPKLSHIDMEIIHEPGSRYGQKMSLTPATTFVFTLQFLMFANELKNIRWKLNLKEKGFLWKLKRFLVNNECQGQSINFRGGLRDLRSSNIWDCFPALQNVEVEIQTNTCDCCFTDYCDNITKVIDVWKRGQKL